MEGLANLEKNAFLTSLITKGLTLVPKAVRVMGRSMGVGGKQTTARNFIGQSAVGGGTMAVAGGEFSKLNKGLQKSAGLGGFTMPKFKSLKTGMPSMSAPKAPGLSSLKTSVSKSLSPTFSKTVKSAVKIIR